MFRFSSSWGYSPLHVSLPEGLRCDPLQRMDSLPIHLSARLAPPPHSLKKIRALTLTLLWSDVFISNTIKCKPDLWVSQEVHLSGQGHRWLSAGCWILAFMTQTYKKKKNPEKWSEWRTCQKWAGAAGEWRRLWSSERRESSQAALYKWRWSATGSPVSENFASVIFWELQLKSSAVSVEY